MRSSRMLTCSIGLLITAVGTAWPQSSVKTSGDVETAAQLKSTVASGTAPLAVSSDTLVDNLNADQVDGFEGADLADAVISVQDQLDAATACRTSSGTLGTVLDGVCLLDWDSTSTAIWSTAVAECSQLGGDLCSVSQYYTLRTNDPDLFYSQRAVWSCDFSDNDNGTKTDFLRSSDNPAQAQQYAYGCCGRVTPEPYRSEANVVNGVAVTLVHDTEDTSFRAAARICHARGSDLCSKSQYAALTGLFSASARRASRDLSDNDGGTLAGILGSNTADNPAWTDSFAFACCASTRPVDGSCPATVAPSGVCYASIHDVEDTTFLDAAADCQTQGADVCSKSQMQSLRTDGLFTVASWTSDGADNDSGAVGGLLGTEIDNPDPGVTLYGYACCP